MSLRLYLVRHGETPYNVESRYQGHQDASLTARGREQAARVGQRLARVDLDAAYSSDLCRAMETAEIAVAGRPLPRGQSHLWREVSYGGWEGMTYAEVQVRWPAQLQARLRSPTTVAPPGGETLLQLRDRVVEALGAIQHARPEGAVLVVSHGGPLRTLLGHLLGVDLDHYWRIRLDLCSISIVDVYEPGAIVSLLNDTSHLDGLHTAETNVFLRDSSR